MQACAVRNALGVIGENHNILSKKSTNRGNFDLLSWCLDDLQGFFLFLYLFIYFLIQALSSDESRNSALLHGAKR